jgi:hypothetical protein
MPGSDLLTLRDLPPKVIVDAQRGYSCYIASHFPNHLSRRSGNVYSSLGWAAGWLGWLWRGWKVPTVPIIMEFGSATKSVLSVGRYGLFLRASCENLSIYLTSPSNIAGV